MLWIHAFEHKYGIKCGPPGIVYINQDNENAKIRATAKVISDEMKIYNTQCSVNVCMLFAAQKRGRLLIVHWLSGLRI